jgi:AraC family transcriptional regulator of adaptative response/methylated-DNA-[protein]-cysteine methyltransferase
MSPTVYRPGAVDTLLRFAVGQCSLGAVLVAEGPAGVCAILLGNDPEALESDLAARFPEARLLGSDPGMAPLLQRVVGLVEAPQNGSDFPLAPQGTPFQLRVWLALRAIPPGRTASYADIARSIGMPRAARAVARACAANPLAVAIPCHRVVARDGSLSGYRWGVERKRALLQREAHR